MSPFRELRDRLARLGRSRAIGAGLVTVALITVTVATGDLLIQRRQHLTKLEPIPSGSAVRVRPFSHVFLIVFENKSEGDIIGSPDAPTFRRLTAEYGLALDYQAVAHPSQPNYLALFSGSTQDVFDDNAHDLSAPNLADLLEARGLSWRVNAEDLPATSCFTGLTSSDGPDGPGVYARKHNPAISFTSISGSPSRCASIQGLATFDPAAATFTMIVPNMCHVMHDCPVKDGDTWLHDFLPRILDSPAWHQGGVLFITFDEGAEHSSRNEVPTLVIAADVPAGMQAEAAHTHFSLLRTIEDGLGLPCLAESCNANTMGEFFGG